MLKSVALVATLVLVSAKQAEAEQPRVMLGAGLGLGELIHAEAGVFLTPRVLVEARAGWLIFNPLIGLAGSYSFGAAEVGSLPRHGWLVRGEAMVNPTLGQLQLDERGEVLGAYAAVYGGYAFTSDAGFYLRGLAGVLLGREHKGPLAALGPNFTVTLGKVF